MDMQPLTRSQQTHGRYVIGGHELTSSDLIEFADDDQVVLGHIEHDGLRYIVVAAPSDGRGRRLPLGEIVAARYMGSGRL